MSPSDVDLYALSRGVSRNQAKRELGRKHHKGAHRARQQASQAIAPAFGAENVAADVIPAE